MRPHAQAKIVLSDPAEAVPAFGLTSVGFAQGAAPPARAVVFAAEHTGLSLR